jgi:hypothetical protein
MKVCVRAPASVRGFRAGRGGAGCVEECAGGGWWWWWNAVVAVAVAVGVVVLVVLVEVVAVVVVRVCVFVCVCVCVCSTLTKVATPRNEHCAEAVIRHTAGGPKRNIQSYTGGMSTHVSAPWRAGQHEVCRCANEQKQQEESAGPWPVHGRRDVVYLQSSPRCAQLDHVCVRMCVCVCVRMCVWQVDASGDVTE